MCNKKHQKIIFNFFYIKIYISCKNFTLFRKLINVFYIIEIPLSCGFVILTFLPLPNPFPGETPVREHVLLYSARFPLNKMGFGDLKKKEGLSVLNAYLADKSYIEGLVYFYRFFSFRIKHFWKKGGMGLHCILHVQFPSKSSTISDTYATHWKFSCPRLVTVLKYFDMWYKDWGNIWQMV